MAITLTEPADALQDRLLCVKAVITKDDADLETTNAYFGLVVGMTIEYGDTVPANDWDLKCIDEKKTDLTDGNGEALDGSTTNYLSQKVQQFGPNDMSGGVPVFGKITFGESGMATGSAEATVSLFIMPSEIRAN